MRYLKKEHFKSLLINSKGEILSVEDVSIGELSSTVVHPREVFCAAVKKSAAAIIFAHNHPSGDPTPSKEDVVTTGRLIESGELLGIKVLDHIIIGDGEYSSLRALGLFDTEK
ncbi:MAG: JAB domain-containing protein, partial [Eubacteriales bacterium]|nr:JAB domain-containing protein [Eubacteriales bacterium]